MIEIKDETEKVILVGVALLFEGILNLCVAIYTVKIIKNQKQDIIDMDEY